LAAESGIAQTHVERLLGRYGSLLPELLAMVGRSPDLARPLAGAEQYLAVEAVYAASHEGALHLDDVLARRTHISIETADRGVGAAEPVARLMAGLLGWDEAAIAREVQTYRLRVAAERASQEAQDDRSADAARLGAPDIRTPAAVPAAAGAGDR
jgi:glycerol-3-phosphate dehydrogenase